MKKRVINTTTIVILCIHQQILVREYASNMHSVEKNDIQVSSFVRFTILICFVSFVDLHLDGGTKEGFDGYIKSRNMLARAKELSRRSRM